MEGLLFQFFGDVNPYRTQAEIFPLAGQGKRARIRSIFKAFYEFVLVVNFYPAQVYKTRPAAFEAVRTIDVGDNII